VIFALTFQNHTNCPLTDFGGKTSIFSHPVYLFLGSLVSRISGAVHPYRIARRVRHGVVFFTDIQGTVM
ncbi:hypothetical protein ACRWFW_24845, partial [Escherichia coli]